MSARRFTVLGLAVLSACVTVPVEQKRAAAPIRNISIQKFEGKGSVEVVAEFTRALTRNGIHVVNGPRGVDAILMGIVTEYKSGRKLMVVLGTVKTPLPNGQTAAVSDPVMPLNGSANAPLSTMSSNNPKIVIENSVVGILIKLVEVPSGHILWAHEYSYESLELQSAMQAAVHSITRSLQRALPQLHHLESRRG